MSMTGETTFNLKDQAQRDLGSSQSPPGDLSVQFVSDTNMGRVSSESQISSPVSTLAQDFEQWKALFSAQSLAVQEFLDQQATFIVSGMLQNVNKIKTFLPAEIVHHFDSGSVKIELLKTPANQRVVIIQRRFGWFKQADLLESLCRTLDRLESSSNLSLALSAGLLRYSVVCQLVRMVQEETNQKSTLRNLILPAAEGDASSYSDKNQDQSPHNIFALAEQSLKNLGSRWRWLENSVVLAPYFVADGRYQGLRTGLRNELREQGCQLAYEETRQMIAYLKRRVSEGRMNRGLHLHLPYFDDLSMELKTIEIHMIPAGKVMFHPAFVLQACRREKARTLADIELNSITKKQILANLEMVETSFSNHQPA